MNRKLHKIELSEERLLKRNDWNKDLKEVNEVGKCMTAGKMFCEEEKAQCESSKSGQCARGSRQGEGQQEMMPLLQ